MNSDQKLPGFLATRSVGDRRNGNACVPPCATGTGMVLIERRSGNDRRDTQARSNAVAEEAGNIKMPID